MVATVANAAAWVGCAVLAFALIRDFVSVERESRLLEQSNEKRSGEPQGRGGAR